MPKRACHSNTLGQGLLFNTYTFPGLLRSRALLMQAMGVTSQTGGSRMSGPGTV